MIIDRQNQFSDDQAITTDAISRVIDLGPFGGATANTKRDIGAGKPLYLHVLVTETFDTAEEDGTLDVTLESDDDAALGSASVHKTISQFAEAALTAGTWICKGEAIPSADYQRYLGLRFNVGSHAFTAGKVKAWLSENRYDNSTYESGYSTGVN